MAKSLTLEGNLNAINGDMKLNDLYELETSLDSITPDYEMEEVMDEVD